MATQLKHLRFRPRPLATLTAVAFTALFAGLGIWQLHRAQEKERLASAFEAQRALPALDLAVHRVDIEQDRYRDASLTGHYLTGHQILVDNVVFDGKPGYQVFAPLQLNGRPDLILIDRGWVSAGASRQQRPRVGIPAETVTITGWLDHPRSLPVIIAGDIDASETFWPYLDTEALSARIGAQLLPYVIHAVPADDALLAKAPQFESKVGMHIGYAIQWFAFAAVAAGAYIALNLKKTA